jgi:hypothetical protein
VRTHTTTCVTRSIHACHTQELYSHYTQQVKDTCASLADPHKAYLLRKAVRTTAVKPAAVKPCCSQTLLQSNLLLPADTTHASKETCVRACICLLLQVHYFNTQRKHRVEAQDKPLIEVRSRGHSLTYSLTHSLTHSFTHSLTHSLARSFTPHSSLLTPHSPGAPAPLDWVPAVLLFGCCWANSGVRAAVLTAGRHA